VYFVCGSTLKLRIFDSSDQAKSVLFAASGRLRIVSSDLAILPVRTAIFVALTLGLYGTAEAVPRRKSHCGAAIGCKDADREARALERCGPYASDFRRSAQTCAAPTALICNFERYPRLPPWAKLCRADGADFPTEF
jgi:hypothetical protein